MKPSDFSRTTRAVGAYVFSLPDLGVDYATLEPDPSFFAPKLRLSAPGGEGARRGSSDYAQAFAFPFPLAGMTVIDICSGVGCLDVFFARGAASLVRIDPLYRERRWREDVLAQTRHPDRVSLVPESVFATGLPANIADLVLENFGLYHYADEVLLGEANRDPGRDGPFARGSFFTGAYEEEIRYVLQHAPQRLAAGILTYAVALEETLRLTKPGGLIALRPNVCQATTRLFVRPMLESLAGQGISLTECEPLQSYTGTTFHSQLRIRVDSKP